MKVNGIPTRTIRSIQEGAAIEIIDQTQLPYRFQTRVIDNWRDAVRAIQRMWVRGAPLIGITGAWAVVLALKECRDNPSLVAAADVIRKARPTAVNLSWAVNTMLASLLPRQPQDRLEIAIRKAERMTQQDVLTCRAIGGHGARIIADLYAKKRRPINILTHCNAGWLATVDYGTALSPIYQAHDAGVPLHVWVDETRPRNQGLLTEWELRRHGVPHTFITDNAGGHLMRHGRVDLVIVGADRITRKGYVANKVGTYLKALAAFDNEIPFYVAAPESTIDWHLENGDRIEIENRARERVTEVWGMHSKLGLTKVRLLPEEISVSNPAFDITPCRLVTGFMTERGVCAPENLKRLFKDRWLEETMKEEKGGAHAH